MPLYEYLCGICGRITCDRRAVSDKDRICICEKCGGVARKIISLPSARTDGDFVLTGKRDKRLGGPPIKGRKDYEQRIKAKGLRELTPSEARDMRDDSSERKIPDIPF